MHNPRIVTRYRKCKCKLLPCLKYILYILLLSLSLSPSTTSPFIYHKHYNHPHHRFFYAFSKYASFFSNNKTEASKGRNTEVDIRVVHHSRLSFLVLFYFIFFVFSSSRFLLNIRNSQFLLFL